MSILYPMNQLMILDYNRVLKSINDMTTQEFLEKMSVDFHVNEMDEGANPKPQ